MATQKNEMNRKQHLFPAIVLLLALTLAACSEVTPEVTPAPVIPTSAPSQALPTAAISDTQAPATEPQSTETQPAPQPAQPADATAFPNPDSFDWQAVASGFSQPVDLADPNDGSGRLLIVEQGGVIRIIENGAVSGEPFLDLTDRVGSNGSEQGLLGMALDPEYANNGIFYLNYTDLDGDTVVSRFQRVAEGVLGDPGSEQKLFTVDQPFANHNGGDLEFGPDGMLYIGLGDGGSAGDPRGNAQNANQVLGKMLRIDVRGKDSYTIPADNPYASGGGSQEVWALGLRNPWRYSFDRVTGDFYIADVGQNQYEEVDFLPAGSAGGANFGWDFREGQHEYEGSVPGGLDLIDPIFEYDHGQGCSITGGYVYRGSQLPEFYGIYLVADYCTGYIWGLLRDSGGGWLSQLLWDVDGTVSSFGQDSSGELYRLDHSGGTVYQLVRR